MNSPTRNKTGDDLPWPVAFRFGNVMLSCTLLALGGGQSLTANGATQCWLWGLNGLAFYFCLELVAHQRARSQAKGDCRSTELRLTRRLKAENNIAGIHRGANSHDHGSGNIESAMDSTAELAVYLGLPTQSTLSV